MPSLEMVIRHPVKQRLWRRRRLAERLEFRTALSDSRAGENIAAQLSGSRFHGKDNATFDADLPTAVHPSRILFASHAIHNFLLISLARSSREFPSKMNSLSTHRPPNHGFTSRSVKSSFHLYQCNSNPVWSEKVTGSTRVSWLYVAEPQGGICKSRHCKRELMARNPDQGLFYQRLLKWCYEKDGHSAS